MSRASKLTFITTCAVSTVVVVGVHYLQQAEKAAMHAGVTRDEERQRLKRERQLDFETQAALEKELRKVQAVQVTVPPLEEGGSAGTK